MKTIKKQINDVCKKKKETKEIKPSENPNEIEEQEYQG
jgi:hypothetical protein